MTVMSGFGGAPVVSMTVTCVIATMEAAALAPANAAASAQHSTSNALMSYSSRSQIDGRRFRDNGVNVHQRILPDCRRARFCVALGRRASNDRPGNATLAVHRSDDKYMHIIY